MMWQPEKLYEQDRRDFCREALGNPPFLTWEQICAKYPNTERFYREQCTRLNHLDGTPERDDFDEPVEVPPFFATRNEYFEHDAKRVYNRKQFLERFGSLGPAIDGADPWEKFCYKLMFWRVDSRRPGAGTRIILFRGSTGLYTVVWSRSLAEQYLEKYIDMIDVTGQEFHEANCMNSAKKKTTPTSDGLEDLGDGLDDGLGDGLDDGLGDGLDDGLDDDGL